MNKNYCRINVPIGKYTRLSYDNCAYDDKLDDSVGPLQYIMDANKVRNCEACLPQTGSMLKYGVAIPPDNNEPGSVQNGNLINLESILTNRNVKNSRCKRNGINPINPTAYKFKNPRMCNKFMNPVSTRLEDPSANYRDLSINRFHDLNRNPQANLFWNFETNTSLEAKDNYDHEIPRPWSNLASMPKPKKKCPDDIVIRITPPC